MIFCDQCGTKSEEGGTFCGNCGSKLDSKPSKSHTDITYSHSQSQIHQEYSPSGASLKKPIQPFYEGPHDTSNTKEMSKTSPLLLSLIIPGAGMLLTGNRKDLKTNHTLKAIIVFFIVWITLGSSPLIAIITWIAGLVLTNQAINEYNNPIDTRYSYSSR